jgi:glucosamine-6-phosphate deaminase
MKEISSAKTNNGNPERIPVRIFSEAGEASIFAAREIRDLIVEKQSRGEKCVLGLATGSSPLSVYDELVRMHREEGLSFRNVVSFNLDEYYPMDPSAPQSYVYFMRRNLFDHIDIDPLNIHIPDGAVREADAQGYCESYEAMIEEAGGIDIQLLGIGRTGHIGFNEPGSWPTSPTRIVTLDHITIADAAGDFFGEENVPSRAISMGVGTIMKARRVLLLAWGEGKAHIIRETVEGDVRDTVPATFLQRHPDVLFVMDTAAAAELTRIRSPWLLGPCDWSDDRLVRRAVLWLCGITGKPILKLTNREYMDNGMYDLISARGDSYGINIRVFNDLQHTITGWPGGKPEADDTNRPERSQPYPKRVLIFSPHPDDDVISMGGTLIRLVDQGHDVHVAYQTSGNIAVFDDDVLRFADFVRDFESHFQTCSGENRRLLEKITDFLEEKKPGDLDTPEALKMKELIRSGEARAACRFIGIPESNIHFLDLPFYRTGTIRKSNIGAGDTSIVAGLLQRIRPHQIYAAGDLSDPHGTHRLCLKAVLAALDDLRGEEWMKECYMWLYRGAWQEWDLAEADMAVPLSPSELLRKRKAIFKHQSQKDRPLFPGIDSREFWQRSEARNRETAARYDRLGMAEYEAIEVFRRYRLS